MNNKNLQSCEIVKNTTFVKQKDGSYNLKLELDQEAYEELFNILESSGISFQNLMDEFFQKTIHSKEFQKIIKERQKESID